MIKILRVGAVGGDMLDIHLDNGNILMLEMERLLALADYSQLREDDRVLYPHTDGTRVYWRNGSSITLSDIFTLMQANKKIEEVSKL